MESFQIGILEMVISIVTLVVATGITFYVKDLYQKRSEYKKLEDKINKIAGKGATVIYSESQNMFDRDLYTIDSIDPNGVVLKSKVQTIFLPIKKVLESEFILPADNYGQMKTEKMQKDMEQMADAMVPALMDRMIPAIMEGVKEFFLDGLEPGGEFDAVVGLKIQKALEVEGLEVKQKESKENTKK